MGRRFFLFCCALASLQLPAVRWAGRLSGNGGSGGLDFSRRRVSQRFFCLFFPGPGGPGPMTGFFSCLAPLCRPETVLGYLQGLLALCRPVGRGPVRCLAGFRWDLLLPLCRCLTGHRFFLFCYDLASL